MWTTGSHHFSGSSIEPIKAEDQKKKLRFSVVLNITIFYWTRYVPLNLKKQSWAVWTFFLENCVKTNKIRTKARLKWNEIPTTTFVPFPNVLILWLNSVSEKCPHKYSLNIIKTMKNLQDKPQPITSWAPFALVRPSYSWVKPNVYFCEAGDVFKAIEAKEICRAALTVYQI